MNVLVQITMGLLLLCSLAGYMLFIRGKKLLKTEFIPVFVFSAIACMVYLSGLAGLLLPGSVFVLAGGVFLFGISAFRLIKSKHLCNLRISLFQFGFITGSLFFFHVLLSSRLIHYDNFSHWAIVIKQMLSSNAFPDASSALIDFKNYPLGTSSFIYFICSFAGNSQQVMLFAQGLFIFSGFYAIFGVITEKKRFLLYAFLAAGCSTLSIFNLTIRINNLLVDFLLPVFSLVLLVIVYQYRKDIKKACITMIPIAGLLTVIKNTGIIYAGIGILFLIYVWFTGRKKTAEKSGLAVLLSSAAALIPYVLWSRHVAVVFRGIENKFELSGGGLKSAAIEKSPEEIRQIIHLFVKTVFDVTSRPFMGVILFHLGAVLLSIAAAVVLKKKWNLWKALAALDFVLIAYYLGILGLYIYSMPLDEAIRLAGFERYASSIVILYAGGLLLCATVDIERSFCYKTGDVPAYRAFKSVESKKRYQAGTVFCLAFSIILLMSEYNGMQTIQRSYPDTLPYKVSAVTGDRWYPAGKMDESRYLFYASDADGQVTDFYLQYIARYMLYAPHVDGICAFYEDNLIHLLSGYDYLVIVESDSDAKYLMNKYFHVSGQNGIYKITPSGEGLTVQPVL